MICRQASPVISSGRRGKKQTSKLSPLQSTLFLTRIHTESIENEKNMKEQWKKIERLKIIGGLVHKWLTNDSRHTHDNAWHLHAMALRKHLCQSSVCMVSHSSTALTTIDLWQRHFWMSCVKISGLRQKKAPIGNPALFYATPIYPGIVLYIYHWGSWHYLTCLCFFGRDLFELVLDFFHFPQMFFLNFHPRQASMQVNM